LRDRYQEQIRARFPDIPRRVSGYNLPALLPEEGFNVAAAVVGSEGTCVTVLRAQLRLVPWPTHRRVIIAGFDDITAAAAAVPGLLKHQPIGVEAFDQNLVNVLVSKHRHHDELRELPPGGNYLLVEFGDDDPAALTKHVQAATRDLDLASDRVKDVSEEEAEPLWQVREAALGAVALLADGQMTWPGWEDSAVAPDRLAGYLRELIALFDSYGWTIPIYGHFGDGCVHLRIPFDLTSRAGLEEYRTFMGNAARLVVAHGGSLSGEHGDGQQRAELLDVMFSDELIDAMK
jgi:FAD/FMN-containing dehydrogenase